MMLVQLQRIYIWMRWEDNHEQWGGKGLEWGGHYFKVLSQNSPAETEGIHEKSQLGQLVMQAGSEQGISH